MLKVWIKRKGLIQAREHIGRPDNTYSKLCATIGTYRDANTGYATGK